MKERKQDDYQLSEKEKEKIFQLFPHNQTRVQLCFKTIFSLDNKLYQNGIIGLSEHFIVLFKRVNITNMPQILSTFHLLQLESINVISKEKCKVLINEVQLDIVSSQVIRFCKCVIRDYYVITAMYPPFLRFQLTSYDPSVIPPFAPDMSPLQMFQFLYNAECSNYHVKFSQSMVHFFANQIFSNDGIFDLSKISPSYFDCILHSSFSSYPLFQSLLFCPLIYGIFCKDRYCPDILHSLGPLIVANSNIQFISIKNSGIIDGAKDIVDAINKNPSCKIQYWDLSNNPINDLITLCLCFKYFRTNIFYLDLSMTKMSEDVTSQLFESLSLNNNMYNLKYLHIAGAAFNKKAENLFNNYLQTLNKNHKSSLISLNIGYIKHSIAFILLSLNSYPQPLQKLNLGFTALGKTAIKNLLLLLANKTISSNLIELNLNGTSIPVQDICQIIQQINRMFLEPRQNQYFSLDIGNLNLNGENLLAVISSLETTNLAIWKSFSFQENNIEYHDFIPLIKLLKKMPNLSVLRIGGNFQNSFKTLTDITKVREVFNGIYSLKSLSILSLQGSSNSQLKDFVIKEILSLFNQHASTFQSFSLPEEKTIESIHINEEVKLPKNQEPTHKKRKNDQNILFQPELYEGDDTDSISSDKELVSHVEKTKNSNSSEDKKIQSSVFHQKSMNLSNLPHFIQSLDLSHNKIGQNGLISLVSFIRENNTLTEIEFDYNKIQTSSILFELMDALLQNQTISISPLPIHDIRKIALKTKSKEFLNVLSDKSLKLVKKFSCLLTDQLHPEIVKNCPELDERFQNISANIQRDLDGVSYDDHQGLSRVFNLPLCQTSSPSQISSETEGDLERLQTLEHNSTTIPLHKKDLSSNGLNLIPPSSFNETLPS